MDSSIGSNILKHIFSPRSVAVIGATNREGSLGNALFANILLNKYKGVLYPVNPKTKSVLGVRCYPSVLDIPDEVDLAVVLVPRDVVPQVARECGEKGIKGMVVITAGFKEVGRKGVELERELVEIVKNYGIRMIGPNCLGVINTDPDISLNANFAQGMPKRGNIAFISQSGALCATALDYAKGKNIGFSKFVSMGNKGDVSENDLLLALRDDPKTDVILMYVENLTNGRRFIELAREITGDIERPKPILAIKSGRTREGAKAASSHTGALSGSDEVYDAVFAQCGVLRVDSMEELFDNAVAFAHQPLPEGKRVAIVTNAGGPGILATDSAIRYGLELAVFSKGTIETLRDNLPPAASYHNPVDMIADAGPERYSAVLRSVIEDENTDSILVILVPPVTVDAKTVGETVVSAVKDSKKPILASFMGIVDVSEGVRIIEDAGIPNYIFPEAAARVMSNMWRYNSWIRRPRTGIKSFDVDKKTVDEVISRAKDEGRRFLLEYEGMRILRAYGFPVVETDIARTEDEAIEKAEKIGYPVVLKISSPDIIHKFDFGGVKLGLEDKDALVLAYREIIKSVKEKNPSAKIEGVTLQRMLKGGKEVIIGMNRDPVFGPILLFGLGGIYVETFKDVTFRIAPIRELSALNMIKSIRSHKILEGTRGGRPSDINAIAECLERLSQLAVDFGEIDELDINPLIVFEEGAKVVDIRIILGDR